MDINNENSFYPTPKLTPSPVPILFIPFNKNEDKCSHCNSEYFKTLLFKQKYCKNCLFYYIKHIITYTTDDNIYLDVLIVTKNIHEATRNTDFCTRNIQEWCKYCSEILYFNQMFPIPSYNFLHSEPIENIKDCKLCGKLIYQQSFVKFKLCSDCYFISSGWVDSYLARKSPILYLPWWDSSNKCIVCNQGLKSISDCQKWCSHCFVIYTGCRYCLTTNIIFGIADKSHCRKCKRILHFVIDITDIISGNSDIDDFLCSTRFNMFANFVDNIDDFNNKDPLDIYNFVRKFVNIIQPMMEWIPQSQIRNLEKIAEGGYGIVYKATWLCDRISHIYRNQTVAVKKYFLRDIKAFLNELKSLFQCYDKKFIIKYYGITQDPESKDYMLIMEYANGENLYNYIQKNFTNITWNRKLNILWKISLGLCVVHERNFIHRDFHSGNILLSESNSYQHWKIGDLGLSQPANNTSNDEIYGVIPYIAPEIFNGAKFSKESDIYSMGMIIWELTTGCKPFSNVEHDTDLTLEIIDGKRPEITDDTPECFANLMKRCWDSDPVKRPSAEEIYETIHYWLFKERDIEQFNQAEEKRLKLIGSKLLGPEFTTKSYSGAIYFSRMLELISNSSSNLLQEYISKECDFDIFDININNHQITNSLENNIDDPLVYEIKPKTEEYMIHTDDNLRDYLRKNFSNITWMNKLFILRNISERLHAIHKKSFIHRELHCENILLNSGSFQIGKLEFLQPADGTSAIYVKTEFSRESDVYNMGIIMWELAGCIKSFDNVEFIYNTETSDTPECFINLMKKCLDPNPSIRPSAEEILETFYDWSSGKDIEQFIQAENNRIELIGSNKFVFIQDNIGSNYKGANRTNEYIIIALNFGKFVKHLI